MKTILLMKWLLIDPQTKKPYMESYPRGERQFRLVLDNDAEAALEEHGVDAAGDPSWIPVEDSSVGRSLYTVVLTAAILRLVAGGWATRTAEDRRTIDLGVFENARPVLLSEVA